MLLKYRKLERNELILVGVDTAAGGGDYVAGQFLSKDKIDIPWVYHSGVTATEFTNRLAPILEEIYDITGVRPVVAYERANGGAFEMDRLGALNRLGKYTLFKMPTYGNIEQTESVKWGWDTNSATRPKMLQDLKEAIDKMLVRIYHKQTVAELHSFIVSRTSSSWKAQAETGSHDDLVMALAIAWQMFQVTKKPITQSFTRPPVYTPVDNVIGI